MFVSLLFLQGERGVITAVMPQTVQAYALLNPILRKLHLAVQPIMKFASCHNSYPCPTSLDRDSYWYLQQGKNNEEKYH